MDTKWLRCKTSQLILKVGLLTNTTRITYNQICQRVGWVVDQMSNFSSWATNITCISQSSLGFANSLQNVYLVIRLLWITVFWLPRISYAYGFNLIFLEWGSYFTDDLEPRFLFWFHASWLYPLIIPKMSHSVLILNFIMFWSCLCSHPDIYFNYTSFLDGV